MKNKIKNEIRKANKIITALSLKKIKNDMRMTQQAIKSVINSPCTEQNNQEYFCQ